MKPGLAEIVVIMDQSGSMNSIKGDAIGGFNQLLEEQKKLPGEARMTMVLFDSANYNEKYLSEPIANVEPLNENTYRPGTMTPLLDAIGRTINSVGQKLASMPEEERPSKVLVAIITDGVENDSREFTSKRKIKEMVEHQTKKYNWDFIFLGANMDAIGEGNRLGIINSVSYVANSIGTRSAYGTASASFTQARSKI